MAAEPPTGNPLDLIDFDAYDDKELSRLSVELTKKVNLIEVENNMFESYLLRVTPTGREDSNDRPNNAAAQDDNNAANPTNNATSNAADAKKEARREKKKKGEKVKEVDRPVLLTSEQKSDIATRELEELKDQIQRDKEEWAKVIDNFKAELEESEIRFTEIKKALYEFKRDIEGQALNSRTGKVIAERIVRYFEDKIRGKDAIIEKIRLKNVTLKVQKNKLHLQLKQKEEMGEVLHAIDFDQLQIENKQYMLKIEERNTELLKLKMTAGNSIQTLNSHKKRLSNLSQETYRLRTEIEQRRDLLSKLQVEEKVVDVEKGKASKLNNWLNRQIDEYSVPEVMDYVFIKASQHELQKKLKGWNRKVEITSLQTKRMRLMWSRMCQEAEQEIRIKRKVNNKSSGQHTHLPDLKLKVG